MNRYAMLLLPAMLAVSGCEVLYDIQQDRTEDGCNRLARMDERTACLQRNRATYQQYERERDRLKHGQSEKPAPRSE